LHAPLELPPVATLELPLAPVLELGAVVLPPLLVPTVEKLEVDRDPELAPLPPPIALPRWVPQFPAQAPPLSAETGVVEVA